jgi:hypothetical protein
VWVDAGITMLRPLAAFLVQADQRGYLVVSQKVENRKCISTDYYPL